jgi:hypothetical protein
MFISALWNWQQNTDRARQLWVTEHCIVQVKQNINALLCAEYHKQQQSGCLTVHFSLPLSTFCLRLSSTA